MTLPSSPGPVLLEVVAPIPVGLSVCRQSERMMALAGLGHTVRRDAETDCPAEMRAEVERLTALLADLARRHGERLQIRLVDVQSLAGLGWALRYRLGRYPAFILNGRLVFAGWDVGPLERALESEMASGQSNQCGGRGRPRGRVPAWLRRAIRAAGEVLYGLTVFDWVRDLRRERNEIEHLFVLITFGDMIGLPILPPYYTLRLLPYAVPCIQGWKRCLLRERDLTDLTGLIEGID